MAPDVSSCQQRTGINGAILKGFSRCMLHEVNACASVIVGHSRPYAWRGESNVKKSSAMIQKGLVIFLSFCSFHELYPCFPPNVPMKHFIKTERFCTLSILFLMNIKSTKSQAHCSVAMQLKRFMCLPGACSQSQIAQMLHGPGRHAGRLTTLQL